MAIKIIKIPVQSATVQPCIVQGDTIPKWVVEFGISDGIDLTGATIKMQIYWNNKRLIKLTNGSGITIDSALKFTIDERSKDEPVLPEGIGIGDLEITDANGIRLTYFYVEYTIIKHYTT